MWFLVQIKISICIWNLKSVIRNETLLLSPPLVWRDSKVAGEGRAIRSPTMRLLNVLFKNYRRTCREVQSLAKITLGASHNFGKRKRKKFKMRFSIKHDFGKNTPSESFAETSPKAGCGESEEGSTWRFNMDASSPSILI